MAEHFSIKKKVQEVNKVQRMNQQLIEFKRLQQEKMEKEFFEEKAKLFGQIEGSTDSKSLQTMKSMMEETVWAPP